MCNQEAAVQRMFHLERSDFFVFDACGNAPLPVFCT